MRTATKPAATTKPAAKGNAAAAAAIVQAVAPSTTATQVLPQGVPAMAYSVPTAAQWQAAPTGAQQAALCHACFGNTMPPSALHLAVGPVAPKGKVGGTRQQHGQYLQAAVVALGAAATVGAVLNTARAQAKAQGWAGWASINQGALRCALQQQVIVVK